MTNGDGIFPHQNLFHQEPHDALALRDTKRFRSTAQASQERGERFGQAQECGTVVDLVGDRLPLGTECLLTLMQRCSPGMRSRNCSIDKSHSMPIALW